MIFPGFPVNVGTLRDGLSSQPRLPSENQTNLNSKRKRKGINETKDKKSDKQENNNVQVFEKEQKERIQSMGKVDQKRKSQRSIECVNYKRMNDGIVLSVADEELDYIGDVETEQDEMEIRSEGSSCYEENDLERTSEGEAEIEDDTEIALGATGPSMSEEEKLLSNPSLRKLFNQLLDERIQASKHGESSNSTLLSDLTPKRGKVTKAIKANDASNTSEVPVGYNHLCSCTQ